MQKVEWRDSKTGLKWLGTIKRHKGNECLIERADGEEVRINKALLHEPGKLPTLEKALEPAPPPPAKIHPNALLIQAMNKGHPLDYALGIQFLELALKYAVVQLHIDWTEDVEAVFTPEQLKFCANGIQGFEGATVEEILHRAIFGPGAARPAKKPKPAKRGDH